MSLPLCFVRSYGRSTLLPAVFVCLAPALVSSAIAQGSGSAAQADTEPTHSTRHVDGRQKVGKKNIDKPIAAKRISHPVLWHAPGDIAHLDLFYGQGGKKRAPQPPFVFEGEDKAGTNPKMDVRDAAGKKWRVKTGDEARPEVVASRLLWAVGYYANDDYLLTDSTVSGVRMARGTADVKRGRLSEARFARKPHGQKKIGIWEWKTNPFYGTREFNGLRVMMAVMNNWDLKDENNSVYSDLDTGAQVYLVNDVGATFGANGLGFSSAHTKGNASTFQESKFVASRTSTAVNFATPKKPTAMLLATAGATIKSFAMRSGLDWIGHDVPVADARWMGSILGQLSHQQLTDAFRAGSFPAEDIDSYVSVVESRIAELKQL